MSESTCEVKPGLAVEIVGRFCLYGAGFQMFAWATGMREASCIIPWWYFIPEFLCLFVPVAAIMLCAAPRVKRWRWYHWSFVAFVFTSFGPFAIPMWQNWKESRDRGTFIQMSDGNWRHEGDGRIVPPVPRSSQPSFLPD